MDNLTHALSFSPSLVSHKPAVEMEEQPILETEAYLLKLISKNKISKQQHTASWNNFFGG